MKKVLSFLWLIWFTGWSLVVEMVALGFASMIRLPLSGFDSESEPRSDSKDFTSATNDYFERKSTVLC
jgi:hypothetical protein